MVEPVESRIVSGAPYRTALVLAAVVVILMGVQAAAGMLFSELYRDPPFALEAWRINDTVTLLAAVPLLAISLMLARRGSVRGFLVLMGGMQYALYNYAFYLFGATLNVYFLLYVALVVASGLALIAGLAALDVAWIGRAFPLSAPVRPVAAYMGLWAAALGVAWIGQALGFALGALVPAMGEEPFRLIAALDLTLVVTPVALGAVWLWARQPWGFILAIVLNVKGVLYAGLLALGSLAGGPVGKGGGDGLLALWGFLLLGSLASLLALLASMRPTAT